MADYAPAAHGHGAAGRGATWVKAAEALGVAIMMHGGQGSVHAPWSLAAFERFVTQP